MKDECREIRSMFDRFLDEDLLAGEVSRLREHVEACEGCRVELEGDQEIAAELASLPEMECPEHVVQGIREAVGNREKRIVRFDRKKSRFRTFRWQWATAGLAAAIVLYLLIRIPIGDRGGDTQFAYSPESIRQARNTAKWSVAYAAVIMKNTEKDAIEAALQDRFPATLRKGLQITTHPSTGGMS